MQVPIKPDNFELSGNPKCAHCGKPNEIPNLKITLGYQKRTFRTDREVRHRQIDDVKFQSAIQLWEKTKQLTKTKMNKFKHLDPKTLRMNEQLFWNLIHYFLAHNLPYDIFLPYKDTKEYDDIKK